MDEVGPDTGAESVASFIARRTTAGSYHDIVDSDSVVQLVDYADEAFHVATHGLNRRTTGVSMACRTTDFASMGAEKRAAFISNAAAAAARQAEYVKSVTGIVVPARRVSLADVLAGKPGFISHAECDPARRTDPGKWFPWDEFLSAFSAASGGAPPVVAPNRTERITVDVNLPVLRRGADGFAVKVMQSILNAHGESLAEDGSFGPKTESSVRHRQAVWGIGADGVCGPVTWTYALNLPTP